MKMNKEYKEELKNKYNLAFSFYETADNKEHKYRIIKTSLLTFSIITGILTCYVTLLYGKVVLPTYLLTLTTAASIIGTNKAKKKEKVYKQEKMKMRRIKNLILVDYKEANKLKSKSSISSLQISHQEKLANSFYHINRDAFLQCVEANSSSKTMDKAKKVLGENVIELYPTLTKDVVYIARKNRGTFVKKKTKKTCKTKYL